MCKATFPHLLQLGNPAVTVFAPQGFFPFLYVFRALTEGTTDSSDSRFTSVAIIMIARLLVRFLAPSTVFHITGRVPFPPKSLSLRCHYHQYHHRYLRYHPPHHHHHRHHHHLQYHHHHHLYYAIVVVVDVVTALVGIVTVVVVRLVFVFVVVVVLLLPPPLLLHFFLLLLLVIIISIIIFNLLYFLPLLPPLAYHPLSSFIS